LPCSWRRFARSDPENAANATIIEGMGVPARRSSSLPEMALDRAADRLDDLVCALFFEIFAILVIAFAQVGIEVSIGVVWLWFARHEKASQDGRGAAVVGDEDNGAGPSPTERAALRAEFTQRAKRLYCP
jgi:hypothetical protein